METRGKAHTAELKHLRETGLYQHQMMDGVWDWLGRHDEGVQRELGMLRALLGGIGVVDSIGLIAGGPIKVATGIALTGSSAYATYEGAKRTMGTYQSTEGQQVLDALDLATHPGDRNRFLELAKEAGIAAAPWAAGKFVGSGMTFFQKLKVNKLIGQNGDSLGYVRRGADSKVYTNSNEGLEYVESQLIKMYPKFKPKPGYNGTWYKLPNEAGEFGIRESAEHGKTIDFHIPGYPKGLKLHKDG